MAQANCHHIWTAETARFGGMHVVYCQNCGVEMRRDTLLKYLNAAEALVTTIDEARAVEKAVRAKLNKENEGAEDG